MDSLHASAHRSTVGPSNAACLLALALAGTVFAALVAAVLDGGAWVEFDHRVAIWFGRHADPTLTDAMLLVTHLNSTVAVGVYAALLGAFEAWRRHWRRVALLVLCVGGGLALNDFAKHVMQRARPVFDAPHLTLQTYSFPSGHAAGSTLLYGLLLVGWFTLTPRPWFRAAGTVAVIALVGLVALSRVYLGVHFVSDVLAGCAEGVAWLALCLLAVNAWWPEPAAA